MTTLVFYVLLTLNFESGKLADNDIQTWRRIEILRSDPAPDLDACERGKANIVERARSIWDMISSKTDTTDRITKIEGVCIGMRPNDVIPIEKGP